MLLVRRDKISDFCIEMRRVVNYIFMGLGLLYMISGIVLLFQSSGPDEYSVFFGVELSKEYYVLYKSVIGALLIAVALIDLRKGLKK